MWYLIFCALCIIASTISETTKEPAIGSLHYIMSRNQVIPDVISVPPAEYLIVRYNKVYYVTGIHVNASEMTKKPFVHWKFANPDSFYTLCMVDADYPNRRFPVGSEWQNWLIVNIPGNKVQMGETLTEYVGPLPGPDTGFHRYVILVYQQPEKMAFLQEPRLNVTSNLDKRKKFSVSKFAIKYNLGNPIAGNFFRGAYDPQLNMSSYEYSY